MGGEVVLMEIEGGDGRRENWSENGCLVSI